MPRKKPWWLFLLPLITASILIFWRLGDVPHGMTWDEAAIGYNGYAVVTTRRDEWLQRLPISFKSFGDYKSPLAIYINGLFTFTLGMELWVVRAPFALSGVLAVAAWMWLVRQLWLKEAKDTRYLEGISCLAGLALVTTPWFLHFARTGFESGMALMFLLVGVAGMVWLTRQKVSLDNVHLSRSHSATAVLILGNSVIALAASMYTYHSAKFVVPVLIVSLIMIEIKSVRRNWRWWLTGGFLLALLLLPLGNDLVSGPGGTRFQQATILTKGQDPATIINILIFNVGSHFSPSFLVMGETVTLRHGDGKWGVLLPTIFLLFSVGVLTVLRALVIGRKVDKIWLLGWLWLGAGLLPAVIGIDVPHSNRALLALPGFLLIALKGGEWLVFSVPRWLVAKKLVAAAESLLIRSILGTVLLVHSLLFVSYLHNYYTAFEQAATEEYAEGYLEAFAYVIPYETGESKPEAEKILFTSRYGQPYIYAVFARRTNPIWYQGGSLIKYEFVDQLKASDLLRQNTMVVAAPEDGLPIEQADAIIYGRNGRPRFILFAPKNESK